MLYYRSNCKRSWQNDTRTDKTPGNSEIDKMTTYREYFGLEEYTEEFITRIIDHRMSIYKNKELYQYYSYDEIAEMENCSPEDVRKILTATTIVWNH